MSAIDVATNDAPPQAGRKEWVGLAVLALACLLYVMDLTVLHLAVPEISEDLHPTSTELLWIIDVYGFMVAGALVVMGTLGDRIGRRKLLMIGAVCFGLTSILAAFSNSAEMLIVSRALLGLSGATIAPSTLSLIFHMFPDPKQRGIAIAWWIAAFSAGSVVGPVVGGAMLELFWWGSVFLLALPVMAALLILGPRVLPEYKDPNAGRLDVLSAAMSVVAVLGIVYGIKEIAAHGYSDTANASITVGLLVGVAWAYRQQRLENPMIDVSLFTVRSFNSALTVNFFAIFMMVGYFIFVFQYLQLVLGLSPLEAGLWGLPGAAGFVVTSQMTPRLAHRFTPPQLVGTGLAVAALGLYVLIGVSADNGDRGLTIAVLGSVIISLGMGPVFGLTTELIVGSAPPEKAGAASGISETAAELGGALGIAIFGSVGVTMYRNGLDELPAGVPPEAAADARDTLGGAVAAAADLPANLAYALLDIAEHAFVDGMRLSTAIAAVLATFVAGFAFVGLKPAAQAAVEHGHLVPPSEPGESGESRETEPVSPAPAVAEGDLSQTKVNV
ncbi:MFS transporter [Sporichthya brevicatena]|uniref:MFS transporter n=1 Tax=Sporichthya brevicatena TaxID=171442 RepID=A0ABN1G5M6_9ACTN